MHKEITPEYFLDIFWNELLDTAAITIFGIYLYYLQNYLKT